MTKSDKIRHTKRSWVNAADAKGHFFREQKYRVKRKAQVLSIQVSLNLFVETSVFFYRRIRRIIQTSFLADLTEGPSKDFGGLL